MDTAPIPVETLLAHREWVRSVAVAVARDPNAADDVEQEAWLAALTSPPRHQASLRGWLGAVVRNRARRMGRSDARRDVREAAASRSEATQSAAELAEIADTHRRVVQAVVELAEPYRQTILLRYFEGLAVEDVAARTSVPLDTARSRISRGLARLRERLSRELGRDERPWHLALVPLFGGSRETAASTGAAAGGGVAMATKSAWILGSALAVGGLAALVVVRWPASAEDGTVVAAAPVPAPVPVDEPKARAPAPAPAPDEPKPVAPAKEKLGRTNITGTWQDTPILEVLGEISAKVDVDFFIAAEVVDPAVKMPRLTLEMENADSATLLEIVAGTAGLSTKVEETRVVVLPGDGKRDESRALVPIERLAPGAKCTITVKGIVVDEQGAPVARASVRSAREPPAVTETGADGAFSLEFGRPFGAVSATAPGHIESWALDVDGKFGDTVEVRLALRGTAARVEGAVVDSNGQRVEGAVVQVVCADPSNGATPPKGARAPIPVRVTTGADGRFAADTLVPGVFDVVVHPRQGPGACEKGTAKPDETVHLDVHLPATVVWRGTLRDAGGKPVVRAMISAGGTSRAHTGPDGSFELAGLVPGRTNVQIQVAGSRSVSKWVDVEGGGEFRSDLLIGGGARIAGRVVDPDGKALPGFCVSVQSFPLGIGAGQEAQVTGDDGAFELTALEPGSYRIGVRHESSLPVAVSSEVRTDSGDVEIRIPREALRFATVRARIATTDGRPAAFARLAVRDAGSSCDGIATADGIGAVGLARVPPGRYLVWVSCGQGAIELPARDIGPGEVVDLGNVSVPAPVTVPLRWDVQGDTTSSIAFVRWSRVLSDGSRAACKDPTSLRGSPTLAELLLPPGRYVVRVEGGSIQSAERTVDVAAGGSQPVTVPFRVAPQRRIVFRFPGDPPGRSRMSVSDADGQAGESVVRGGETSLRLVAGSYRVEVDVSSAQKLSGSLDIPAENAPETFDVVLR